MRPGCVGPATSGTIEINIGYSGYRECPDMRFNFLTAGWLYLVAILAVALTCRVLLQPSKVRSLVRLRIAARRRHRRRRGHDDRRYSATARRARSFSSWAILTRFETIYASRVRSRSSTGSVWVDLRSFQAASNAAAARASSTGSVN